MTLLIQIEIKKTNWVIRWVIEGLFGQSKVTLITQHFSDKLSTGCSNLLICSPELPSWHHLFDRLQHPNLPWRFCCTEASMHHRRFLESFPSPRDSATWRHCRVSQGRKSRWRIWIISDRVWKWREKQRKLEKYISSICVRPILWHWIQIAFHFVMEHIK